MVSKNEANAILFKCLDCGAVSVFPKTRQDGNRCPACAGIISPIGEAYIGVDLAKGADRTAYIKGGG